MAGNAAAVDAAQRDYHSLYVKTRAAHEKTVYDLRQTELQLAGTLVSLAGGASRVVRLARCRPWYC